MKKLHDKSMLMFLLSFLATAPEAAFGQAQTPPAPSFVLDENTLMVIVIGLLFFVIAALSYTVVGSMELFKRKNKEKENSGQKVKSVLILVLGLAALQAFGQEAEAPTAAVESVFSSARIMRYTLWSVLALELLTIFILVYWIRFFTGVHDIQNEKATQTKKLFSGVRSWWAKANNFRPIEEEDELDVGHVYDGIRELDNVTPPWFTISFVASIVFGIGYFWNYHVAKASPNQFEEYEIAVTKANLAKEAYLKLKGDAVNENTVVMLDAGGIEAGKTLFANNCAACHGKAGEGTVGPNLTDDYWLHGGKIGDIFKTIKLGVVEKGMMSWKDIFSADQIAQLSSYIKSIHGANPPGAKEKQGELFVEEAATANGSAAPAADSAAASK